MTDSLEAISEKLKALTNASQFQDSVGSVYQMSWGTHESIPLELVAAKAYPHGRRNGQAREPFTLLFRAPSKDLYLPQGTYALEGGGHEILHVFLVPVGPDDLGMCFEAVFN